MVDDRLLLLEPKCSLSVKLSAEIMAEAAICSHNAGCCDPYLPSMCIHVLNNPCNRAWHTSVVNLDALQDAMYDSYKAN